MKTWGIATAVLISCWAWSPLRGESIVHLPLDGHTLDASGKGHHGVIGGHVTFGDGMHGLAAIFDGSAAYIEIPNIPLFQLSSWTLSAWVNIYHFPRTVSTAVFIGKSEVGGAYNYALVTSNDRNVRSQYETCDSEFDHTLASPEVPTNTWLFVASTRDHATGQHVLYLDGLPIDSGTWMDQPCLTESTVKIGFPSMAGVEPIAGMVDDVRIWNHALSPEEVLAHFHASAVPYPHGLTVIVR